MVDKNQLLRQLPAISVLLQNKEVQSMIGRYGHSLVADTAGQVVEEVRRRIIDDINGQQDESKEVVLSSIIEALKLQVSIKVQPKLRRVINATGIILHTNLGRAILGESAINAVNYVARGYSNLELDLHTGERGSRYAHVERLICELTGAEGALVVNNNAAAVLLVLSALARDREVIVSRGQLVEIGGSFRIPDVMKQSGAALVEVGTTNKTHLADYERAINDNTALLLKVHTSNYKIIGFTSQVSNDDLVKLGRERSIPVFEDLGSGVLVDFRKFGLQYEPTVQDSLKQGVDLVSFSGDKLFGGPQAGIIVGRKDLIESCKRNPLTRALRVDKLTFAALEATLRLYIEESKAVEEVPTLRMLTTSYEEMLPRVKRNARRLKMAINGEAAIEVISGYSQVGGGALPEENIPSPLVAIKPTEISVNWLEERLRYASVPVLARIQKDNLLIDFRTVLPTEEKQLTSIIAEVLNEGGRLAEQEVLS